MEEVGGAGQGRGRLARGHQALQRVPQGLSGRHQRGTFEEEDEKRERDEGRIEDD